MILTRVAASAGALALATVLLYAGAVQTADGQARTALSPPIQLDPTAHRALPDEPGELWFVPAGKSRPPALLLKFAEGVRAYAAGNFEVALPLVSAPGLADTALADYATYYKGLTLLRLNRLDEARQALSSLKDRALAGYILEASMLARGEAAELANDGRAAASLYQELSTSKSLVDPEVAIYRLGRALAAASDRQGAAAAWRRLRYEFPLSPEASLADEEMGKLTDVAPTPTESTFKLELGRAERLFGARRYSPARDAFTAIRDQADGDDRELVELRIAESDFYLRRYAAARDALRPYLSGAARAAEAQFFYLASLNELGSDDEYLTRVRALIAAFPGNSWSEEALNNLGTHYILANDDEAAAGAFRELLQRFPNGPRGERAAWKLGWWEYKNGRYAETIRVFEAAAATFPRSDYRPSWIYWAARARERAGDPSNAVARYQLVTADYLNSYYGRLAARRLERLDKVARAAWTPQSPAARATDTALDPPPTAGLVRLLLSLGLEADALNELRYAQRRWGTSPAIEATMAWAYYRQGDLRRAIGQMKRAYPQHLTADGSSHLPDELLRVIFPLDYWSSIQRRARQRNLDPYLVAALIAQESSFESDARSAANAYGLMQVVPGTGRRLARSLGIRYRGVTTLTDADANVRMGTLYFSRLIDQFGGVHLALAAYNAGESRVVRWMAERPGLDRDEFIDDIPFPETQNYVKKILGTAEDYRVLYGERRARAVIDRDEPGKPASAPTLTKSTTPKKAVPSRTSPPRKTPRRKH